MNRGNALRYVPAGVAALLLSALLASCGGGTGQEQAANASADSGVLRFRKLEVYDPAAGVNAFTMLVPVGWQREGGIIWRPHLSNQAAAAMRIWDPSGSEVLELMPCDPFTWQAGGVFLHQPGSIYLGNEVLPPTADAQDYVLRVAIPRYRQQISNPQVVETEPLPKIAQVVAQAKTEPGVRKVGHAARVRVAYAFEGRQMHEDFYCVILEARPFNMPGLVFWGPDSLYSFRAEAGHLDKSAALLQTMVTSVRITPEWFNIVAQIQQMWVHNQMQSIRNAGRISRYISQTSRDISDMMMQSYENRQASMDRINREYSEYIRGVETYSDPFRSAPVQLPSQYGNAWVSPGGEYILSESPSFNPNVGDTRNWRRMEPAR